MYEIPYVAPMPCYYPPISPILILILISIPIIAYFVFLKNKKEKLFKHSSRSNSNVLILIFVFIGVIFFSSLYYSPFYWFDIWYYDPYYVFYELSPIIVISIPIIIGYYFYREKMKDTSQLNQRLDKKSDNREYSEFSNQFRENNISFGGKSCSKCNTNLKKGALFCHNCGKAVNTEIRFCSYCGTYKLKNSVFCHKCGNMLREQNLTLKNGEIGKSNGKYQAKEGKENFFCPYCGNNFH